MEIKTSVQDEVTVIHIAGNLDSNTSPQAEGEISKFIADKCCLVLDMEQCKYISSAGLRVLLAIGKQLQANSGCWAFAGLSSEVIDVMNMTGFSAFFKICPSMDEAIKIVKG